MREKRSRAMISGTEELYMCDALEARGWYVPTPIGKSIVNDAFLRLDSRTAKVVEMLQYLYSMRNVDRTNASFALLRDIKDSAIPLILVAGVAQWLMESRPCYEEVEGKLCLKAPAQTFEEAILISSKKGGQR
jgi:hypothetical protein